MIDLTQIFVFFPIECISLRFGKELYVQNVKVYWYTTKNPW